jgi:hypothetical protein
MNAVAAATGCRMTEEGVQQLSTLSCLRDFSYGYTSMPEADDVAAAIGSQFKQLTGENRDSGPDAFL